MRNLISLLLAVLFVPAVASAQPELKDVSVAIGMRSDSGDSEVAGTNTEGRVGFQGGGIARFQFMDRWNLRTGVLMTVRRFDVSRGATVTAEPILYYFDVPAGVQYEFTDEARAFAGLNVGVNVGKGCGTGDCTGVTTFPTFLQVGGSFEIIPRFGIELYYEDAFIELADDVRDPRAIVGQLLFSF